MKALGELLAVIAHESSEQPFEGSPAQKEAWDEVKRRMDAAHEGLKRALDFQTATPHGLAIKADVRKALAASGCPAGEWGEVGS